MHKGARGAQRAQVNKNQIRKSEIKRFVGTCPTCPKGAEKGFRGALVHLFLYVHMYYFLLQREAPKCPLGYLWFSDLPLLPRSTPLLHSSRGSFS